MYIRIFRRESLDAEPWKMPVVSLWKRSTSAGLPPSNTHCTMADKPHPIPEALRLYLGDLVPIQLWMATPDGALDYVNKRVTDYFGRSEEEIIGEGWKNVVHPADLETTGELWKHSLETGEPYRTEFRLQSAADGLYRWHLGLALAVCDEDGNVIRWVGSNTDIDDQKRALEVRDAAVAMAEMERERMEQIIEHAPAVMAIYRGPRHEIVMVNALWEKFTGRTGVIGKPFAEVFPETESQGLIDIIRHVYETGELHRSNEMRLMLDRKGDGELEETFWDFTLLRLGQYRDRGYDLLVHAVEHSEHIRTRRTLEMLQTAM